MIKYAWADSAVKREIANLVVRCNNHEVGCVWTGVFKDLMKHLNECEFVPEVCTNPGCGAKVLKSELEEHLKKKCLYRQVECKDCDKKMSFIELQEHTELCPNAPKVCKNCKKKIPASQYLHHINDECKVTKCVCKEEDAVYEVDSDKFKLHLEDTSKLADHLAPMIREFSKMSLAFLEMTSAYQLSTNRIEELELRNKALEKSAQDTNEKFAILNEKIVAFERKFGECENKVETLHGKVEVFEKHVEIIQKENIQLQKNVSSAVVPRNNDQIEAQVHSFGQEMKQFQQKVGMLEKNWTTMREDMTQLQQQQTIAIKQKSAHAGEVVPYDKPPSSELVRQVEDKVLEVERTLNVLSVHHSELELQLQASLASTHNGAFLWRIPEVRRRMRDAKIGRITSIYSPPFYTGRNGYKMCIRAYLNGDGTGEGTHLSIFFVLMRGEYDPLLQWPFESKVSLILVDQDHKKHLVQTFKPNAQSSSFKRPVSDMNVASGCPEFAELSILDNPSYVKEDVLYIKAIVDTSKIFHP